VCSWFLSYYRFEMSIALKSHRGHDCIVNTFVLIKTDLLFTFCLITQTDCCQHLPYRKKNKESFIHFYNVLEVTHIIKAYMRETGPGSF